MRKNYFNREKPINLKLSKKATEVVDNKSYVHLLISALIIVVFYFLPEFPSVESPTGEVYQLSSNAKMAIGIFFAASYLWVSEALPLGITALIIALLQIFLLIREPTEVFPDYMDNAVLFILSSLVIGLAFKKTKLTDRIAFNMLYLAGSHTRMIYLFTFLMVFILTLFMAHTAVAAAVFPLLITINNIYDDSNKSTKFGKGLFIGMAFVAGAGSIVTLFGSSRGVIALDLYGKIATEALTTPVSFIDYSYYMFPVGFIMTIFIWVYISIVYKPEKSVLQGMRNRALYLNQKLGRLNIGEKKVIAIIVITVFALVFKSTNEILINYNRTSVLLLSTVAFFIFRILDRDDLEEIPWNLILLFGGAISLGTVLWETGAAEWIAFQLVGMISTQHEIAFLIAFAAVVMLLSNFIMNVAAISILLPIALVIASNYGISEQLILFVCLVGAGMPFLLVIGSPPSAIAYESNKFKPLEFFLAGLTPTVIVLAVLWFFIEYGWKYMGMTH